VTAGGGKTMQSAYQWMEVDNSTNITLISFKAAAIVDERVIRIISDELLRLQQTGCRFILLDFSTVRHMSSSILATLITLHKRLTEAKGRLALSSLKSDIAKVFQVTHLDRILTIYPDLDTARLQFHG
jgi:anti-anti-sigma factor